MHEKQANNQRQRGFTVLRNSLWISIFVVIAFVGGAGFGFFARGEVETRLRTGNVSHENLPDNLSYREVEQVYDSLRTNFDGELSIEQLMDGLKDGLVQASGDPYTEYLDAEEATSFDEGLSGSFTGIGAELGKEGQFVVIVSPLSGFPAEKAGLQPRDVIAEINGENAYDISITEAVEKIRGPEGTDVTLGIVRDETERLEITITRAEITIPSVEYEVREDGIGVLRISRFYVNPADNADTVDLVNKAVQEFQARDVKGVILDLRGNPGGHLEAVNPIASLWVESGKVVLDQRQAGQTVETITASGNTIFADMPTVVLINEGSASASEILAGALKDHDKAFIIGETSYGKGSVQQLVDFGDGSQLKVTIARWYTPSGKNIDEEGIEPDKVVELSDEDFQADRDPQLDAALEQLKQ